MRNTISPTLKERDKRGKTRIELLQLLIDLAAIITQKTSPLEQQTTDNDNQNTKSEQKRKHRNTRDESPTPEKSPKILEKRNEPRKSQS